MTTVPCSLCHLPFHPADVVCHSPIFGDHKGVFHKPCLTRVEAIMEEEGTNDIGFLLYPDWRNV